MSHARMNGSPKSSDCPVSQAASPYMASGFMLKQLAAGVITAAGCALFVNPMAGLAVLFGVLLMIGNAAWMDRRMAAVAGLDEEADQRSLYEGAVFRFAGLLIGLLIAGASGLHLLFVALGIFVTQAVLFFAALQRFSIDKT